MAPRRYSAPRPAFDVIACQAVSAKPAVSPLRLAVANLVLRVLLVVAPVLTPLDPLTAAPIEVRFAEGVAHGFLLLRTADGNLIASGDVLQVSRGAKVESRMVFRFKDGSLLD